MNVVFGNSALRRAYLSLFLYAVVAVLTVPIYGQTAALSGTVTDSVTAEPLIGANIFVVSDSGARLGTSSAVDGTFGFQNLAAGTYTITITYTGYERWVRSLQLRDGESRMLAAALRPTVLDLGQTVVVTASRREERRLDAPAAVWLLEAVDIQARPALSPVEHLKGQPGVDVASSGLSSDRVVVRGFNTTSDFGRLLFLTDSRFAGVPGLGFNFYELSPTVDDDIDRIEVAAGPASALYGPNALGGVLQIITKSPFDNPGTVVTITGGERSLIRGTIRHSGLIGNRLAYKISGEYHQGDDWEYVDPVEPDTIIKGIQTSSGRIPRGGPVPNIRDYAQERLGGFGRLDFRPNNNLTAILSGGITRGNWLGIFEGGGVQVEDFVYSHIQARLFYKRLFAQAFVNRNSTDDSFFLRTGDLIVDKSAIYVGQLQHSTEFLRGRQELTYGADLLLTRPDSKSTLHGRNEDKDNIDEIGFYIQSETELSKKLKGVLTLRLDDNNRLDDPVFSPRAALVVKPAANHTFRITFNTAYSSPRAADYFGDVVAVPSLGGLPYAARFRGVPPETGFNFRRGPDGGLGGLFMQSPFNPGGREQYIPAEATSMWGAVVALLQAQGVDISALPAPTPEQVGTVLAKLNVNTGAFDAIAPEDVFDVPTLKPGKITTFEIGYNGVIGDNMLVAVNLYRERNRNFSGTFLIESPNVFLDPVSLVAYLSNFMPPANAAELAAGIAAIPLGTVTPEEADPADLLLTTRSFADISHYGAEIAATYHAGPRWTFGGNYAYVTENYFEREADEPDDVSMNGPQHKFALNAQFRDPGIGIDAKAQLRYVDSFPVISGLGREDIEAYTVVDINATYTLPTLPALEFGLAVQNVLDNRHREFVGAPEIGRLALLRVKYRL